MADSLTLDRRFGGTPSFGTAAVVGADGSQHKLAQDFAGADVVDDDIFRAVDDPDVFAAVCLTNVDFASAEVHRSG